MRLQGHQTAELLAGQRPGCRRPTGAGKSTLLRLIHRFYDVTAGRITIDGVDVRDVDEAALRGTVCVALQEAVLFSVTIRDNIRYGRPDATEGKVVAAARQAQAHDFIARFPDGYDAIVGQRGVNLSGGQTQRLAIARALRSEPAVLLLDDAVAVDAPGARPLNKLRGDVVFDRSDLLVRAEHTGAQEHISAWRAWPGHRPRRTNRRRQNHDGESPHAFL